MREKRFANKAMTVRSILFVLSVMALFLGASSLPAAAQSDSDTWHYTATLYGLGAGMDGTVGARGREADINVSFSDLLKNLQFGFMGAMRAEKGPIAITGDVEFVALGTSVPNPPVKADADQWIVSGDAAYRVSKDFEVLGGIRFLSLQNKIQFQGAIPLRIEGGKKWVDPVLGVRWNPELGQKWSLIARGDIGGFGVGSHFTWQLSAYAVRWFSQRAGLGFGYKVLDVDYTSGEGNQRFVYDVNVSGPTAGLVIRF